MRFRRLAALPFLLLTDALIAQDENPLANPQILALDTLVREVVAWNADLIDQQLSVQIANAVAKGEAFYFEPEFFGSVRYHDTNTPNNAAETISRAGLQTHFERQWNAVAGLTGTLPTGMQWTFEYQQSETSNSVIDTLRDYTYEYESQVKATLRQPLLQGFGPDVVLADLKQSRLESRIIRSAFEERLMDVIAITIREYWKLYGAQVLVESLEDSVSRLEESVSLLEQKLESGEIPESDLIEAKSTLLARRIELRSMRNSVASVQIQILRLLNDSKLAAGDGDLVASEAAMEYAQVFDSLSQYLDFARANRALFVATNLRAEQARLAVRAKRNATFPKVDLVLSWWRSNLDDEWIENEAFKDDFKSYYVGVEFNMPIFGGQRDRAQLSKARLELRQAQNAIHTLERELRLELANYLDLSEASRAQLRDMEETYALKQLLLEGEMERFRAGELGIDDLIEKEEDATAYYRRLVNKLIENKVNEANLDRAAGYLLTRFYGDEHPFEELGR
jgi:outer membrane protein TolC